MPGYQKIWTTIAEKDGLDVRYGVEILDQGIDRQLDDPSAPVRIKYRQKGKNEVIEEEYDFLIYSAPHAHAKNFVKDVAIQEESIFSSLKSFVLATTLYSSEPVLDYTDSARRPIMYEADKMSGPSHDGSWYADRWDDLIFGQPITGRQTRVGYQFYEKLGPQPADFSHGFLLVRPFFWGLTPREKTTCPMFAHLAGFPRVA